MITRQAIVIGLGQFGLAVAQSLHRQGVDVLGIDLREERHALTRGHFDVLVADATEEGVIERLKPADRDLCVVAIGDEAREGSIMVTALLKQAGARLIVARATDDLHARILALVGAHRVVNPERAFGERLAQSLLHEGLLESVPLGEDMEVSEIKLPTAWVGRSLSDLSLPRRARLLVVAVRREQAGHGVVLQPSPTDALREGDLLVTVGPKGAAATVVGG